MMRSANTPSERSVDAHVAPSRGAEHDRMIFSKRIALAASIATVALAGCGSSATTASTSSTAATQTATASAAPTTPMAGGGPGGGGGPGMGTAVTGTAATKAKAAALAKYPGTANNVFQTDDGYLVAVTANDGTMKMVVVSTAFKVTGLQERPTGTPPSGGIPNGTTPPQGAGTSATTPSTATSS
jgi:hypothetical protein